MPLPTNLERVLIQYKDKVMPELDLSEEGLMDSDIVELVKLIEVNNVSISYLNLYRNMIGNPGAIELSSLATVKEINLDANEIKDDGALALFASNIKLISLNDNNLTDACLNALLNCKQQFLEVGNNKFSAESMEKIQSKFSKKQPSSLNIQTSQASLDIHHEREEKSFNIWGRV